MSNSLHAFLADGVTLDEKLETNYIDGDDVFGDKFKNDNEDHKNTLNDIWRTVHYHKHNPQGHFYVNQLDINVNLCASIIQLSKCMSKKFEDIYTKLEKLETKYNNMCDKIDNLETKYDDTNDRLEDLKIEHNDLKSEYEYPYTCQDC